MNVFVPRNTHSSPTFSAAVLILWELEPASGSVMANENRCRPLAIPSSQASFCLVVPYFAIN